MKNQKTLVLLVISIVLSLGIIRTRNENTGAYTCLPKDVNCTSTVVGVKHFTQQGYPLTYWEKEVFTPRYQKDASTAYSDEKNGFSGPRLIMRSLLVWAAVYRK